jgi:aconitate hydratase
MGIDRTVAPNVSLDVNPTSRQILETLVRDGHLQALIHAGARIHQAGCNGCIGMGQAPATGKISLRTVPRNFPGRSGTREDQVCLVSPETAMASALTGEITDPRDLGIPYPKIVERDQDVETVHNLSSRQCEILRSGGLTNWMRRERKQDDG